jgi:hypothetical protein
VDGEPPRLACNSRVYCRFACPGRILCSR